MIRRHFHDLPVEARQAVTGKVGPIHAARTADGGLNSGIAAFIDTDHGPVFVKGIPTDHPQARPNAARPRSTHTSRAPAPACTGTSRRRAGTYWATRSSRAARRLRPGSAGLPSSPRRSRNCRGPPPRRTSPSRPPNSAGPPTPIRNRLPLRRGHPPAHRPRPAQRARGRPGPHHRLGLAHTRRGLDRPRRPHPAPTRSRTHAR
ncbi:hypothetical protein ACR6C2_26950 [Streptomyces sp. INA 01156]